MTFRNGQRVRVAAWDRMKQAIADWRDDELAPVGTLGTVEGDFVRFDSGDRWPVSGTHILKPVEDEKMDATGLLDYLKCVMMRLLPVEYDVHTTDFDRGSLDVCRTILRDHFKLEATTGVVFKEIA